MAVAPAQAQASHFLKASEDSEPPATTYECIGDPYADSIFEVRMRDPASGSIVCRKIDMKWLIEEQRTNFVSAVDLFNFYKLCRALAPSPDIAYAIRPGLIGTIGSCIVTTVVPAGFLRVMVTQKPFSQVKTITLYLVPDAITKERIEFQTSSLTQNTSNWLKEALSLGTALRLGIATEFLVLAGEQVDWRTRSQQLYPCYAKWVAARIETRREQSKTGGKEVLRISGLTAV